MLTQAFQTSAHHGSGGGATLARAGIGIAPVALSILPEELQHKLQVMWVAGMCKGGIYTLNVHLKDGEGLSSTNMYLLEQAAICLRSLKGPWIAGGD